MNILMVASEMEPFARTGSLADAMRTLPGELCKRGHQVSVALPFYRCIRENRKIRAKSTGVKITVPMGNQQRMAEIFETRDENGVQVLLVRRDEYFDRSGLYGAEGEGDYQDNAERFIFFTKCIAELARRLDPAPDLLHAHDWQAALLPLFVKAWKLPFGCALTIHDLAYQGNFWSYDFALTNLGGEWFSPRGAEFYGSMNCLKTGIVLSDAVVVASEPYAREIQTREFGCGLEEVLKENAWKLYGIPAGLNEDVWNPSSDVQLPKNYGKQKIDGKVECREALLKKLKLQPSPKGPVLVLSGCSIDKSCGEMLLAILDRLLVMDVRVVLSGETEPCHDAAFGAFVLRYREKLAHVRKSEDVLLHQMLAGADMAMFPKHLEPDGVLLRAGLKYGAIPILLGSAGVQSMARDFDAATETGSGFLFYDFSAEAFLDAIRRAISVHGNTGAWKSLVGRAMDADFSWGASAEAHERLYGKIALSVPAEKK